MEQSAAGDSQALGLDQPVVVIGAGQAGYGVARALRSGGWCGAITLVGDEDHPPYERPALSKAVLMGQAAPESTYLATEAGLRDQQIDWLRQRAVTVDPAVNTVTLSNGRVLNWSKLVFATGGSARQLALPGADLAGLFTLRNIADAGAIRERLRAGARMVVVGGGWIGLEVAASARKSGLDVTVVEALPRLCARSLPAVAADHLVTLHRAAGVEIKLNTGVRGFTGHGAVEGVELDDGTILAADLVIIAAGMVPNAELARDAGLATASGIVVDADGRTSNPDIFAAGDVAEVDRGGKLVRAESWANANEQALEVAAALAGQPRPSRPAPWFWSDQFDTNIQMLGTVPADSDAAPVVLGSAAEGAVTWAYLDGSSLAAVIAFNRPRDVQAGKRIMARGIAVSAASLLAAGDLAQALRASAG